MGCTRWTVPVDIILTNGALECRHIVCAPWCERLGYAELPALVCKLVQTLCDTFELHNEAKTSHGSVDMSQEGPVFSRVFITTSRELRATWSEISGCPDSGLNASQKFQ